MRKRTLQESNRLRRLAFAQLDSVAGEIIQDDVRQATAPEKQPAHKGRKSKTLSLLLSAAAIAAH